MGVPHPKGAFWGAPGKHALDSLTCCTSSRPSGLRRNTEKARWSSLSPLMAFHSWVSFFDPARKAVSASSTTMISSDIICTCSASAARRLAATLSLLACLACPAWSRARAASTVKAAAPSAPATAAAAAHGLSACAATPRAGPWSIAARQREMNGGDLTTQVLLMVTLVRLASVLRERVRFGKSCTETTPVSVEPECQLRGGLRPARQKASSGRCSSSGTLPHLTHTFHVHCCCFPLR